MTNELLICICIAVGVIMCAVAAILFMAFKGTVKLDKPPGSWTYELQLIPRQKIRKGKFTHSYDGCRIAVIQINDIHDVKADPKEIAVWIGMTYGIPRTKLQVVYRRASESWMGIAMVRYNGKPSLNIVSLGSSNWRAASVKLMEYIYKLELSEFERLKQERAYAKENENKATSSHSEESYH